MNKFTLDAPTKYGERMTARVAIRVTQEQKELIFKYMTTAEMREILLDVAYTRYQDNRIIDE
jgi:hypothetical protein